MSPIPSPSKSPKAGEDIMFLSRSLGHPGIRRPSGPKTSTPPTLPAEGGPPTPITTSSYPSPFTSPAAGDKEPLDESSCVQPPVAMLFTATATVSAYT